MEILEQDKIYVPCNLCGLDAPSQLYQKDGYHIVRCANCRLVYMNPRLIIEKQNKVYTDGDYSAGYIQKSESKRRRAKKILRGISRYKKGGRFLDIGCSAGFILEAARNVGFDPYGVEISPIGYKFAREELKLNVFAGFLEDAHFPDAFFDVVTIYHVIEHVPDPSAVFKEIRRILKSDGLLEVWTPNVGHRNVRRQGAKWAGFISDHFYYFDIQSLGKFLEKVGMRVLKNQFTLKDGLKVYAGVNNGQISPKRPLFNRVKDLFSVPSQ
ncbi:MAG TPA: class I SAM-dependent methyltransferase [Candidatus Omnitrophota bacterium]|nr:class I SAM-dependent methyltransferase [Candidatus Omnitrophota bacterium]